MKLPPIAVLARISDGRTQRLISPGASNEGGQANNAQNGRGRQYPAAYGQGGE